MKKLTLISLIVAFLLPFNSIADEGMWIPLFIKRLNYADMQKAGCKLTPEEIYSVNNASLKDAIVQFGGGCSGEIISDKGLLLTNHHCGLGQIQKHSSVEHDYLTDGFWAMNMDEELVNPGLTAKFLVRIEDVTKQITDSLNNDLSEDERNKIVASVSKQIQKKAEEGTHYSARVSSFFGGNEFYLFVYEIFEDVRLVGTPPWGIGKYGADTDNWMWPRHKGDFCMFRVYTAPDGTPAPYSKDNIPLKPKHHLPVSLKGIEKGDYAMIMGYPGRTDRYLTSWGVGMQLTEFAPVIVDVRTKKLDIYREAMDASDDVRIKYASKQARTSNYWKYSIGQIKQLKQNNVIEKKQQIEKEFTNWVNEVKGSRTVYSNCLGDIEDAYKILNNYTKANQYFMEAIYNGSEIIALAYRLKGINSLSKMKPEEAQKAKSGMTEIIDAHFKDYDLSTDKKVLAAMLEMYHKNVNPDLQPEYFKKLAKKYKYDFNKLSDKLFAKSDFTNQVSLQKIIDNNSSVEKDPVFKLMDAMISNYIATQSLLKEANSKLDKGNRLFIAGLREMNPDKNYSPDANSTMRISYGNVEDYNPRDAVHYDYVTTIEGVMEKEIPGNWEFNLPDKLKDLYNSKDYGRYADKDGRLIVNFITTNDITGGNSGSPVIDGNGNIIGLAFDGNWEAMSGDISFENEVQRTICVDIRYVLFVIDKFAGAKNIVDELTYVN